MKCPIVIGLALAVAATTAAHAAPNVTSITQKGSLLVFPDIRVDDGWNTLVRIQNDGTLDVDVKCYWMDGNKNRVDMVFPVTRNQAVWFDARTGRGTQQVNPFPTGPANGFENPFLPSPNGPAAYRRGLLACWTVDEGGQQQVKWNHLAATASVYHPTQGAYEYAAYGFFVPTGIDLAPVGVAGTLTLDGVAYDACPLYQVGFVSLTPVAVGAGIRTVLSDFGVGALGPVGLNPVGVAVEASGQILVVDLSAGTSALGALFRVDPVAGTRTLLSDFGVGAQGPLGFDPYGVVVEASGQILVSDRSAGTGGRSALFRVDPVTGTRTLLSDFGVGAQGPLGFQLRGVTVEASGQILTVDANGGTGLLGGLLRVDPATGTRTLLSDFGAAGQGPLGDNPYGVAVEASGQIVVVDGDAGTGTLGALYRVDPTTGARTLVSDFGAGAQGPPGVNPYGVAVEAGGMILATDLDAGTGGLGALFRVDPATGTRTLISDFGAGAQGPLGVNTYGVAVDAGGRILVADPSVSPRGALFRIAPGTAPPTRLTLAACTLNLQQDWTPVWTKLQFDVWNEDEIKFTGAYECSDSWHETTFSAGMRAVAGIAAGINAVDDGIDAASQNFAAATLGSNVARYRVQGVKSTQCENATITTQAVGLLAIQSTLFDNLRWVGTPLTGAGKFTGKITWDPAGAVPEGRIR